METGTKQNYIEWNILKKEQSHYKMQRMLEMFTVTNEKWKEMEEEIVWMWNVCMCVINHCIASTASFRQHCFVRCCHQGANIVWIFRFGHLYTVCVVACVYSRSRFHPDYFLSVLCVVKVMTKKFWQWQICSVASTCLDLFCMFQ